MTRKTTARGAVRRGSARAPHPVPAPMSTRTARTARSTRSGADGGAGTDAIYARISEAIAAHKLPPGAKLGEEALGDIFGVSRTKIRQALFQLASDKLVTLIPGRGAFVAQPTVREAQEVFAARRIVEAAVMTQFVARASDKDIATLQKHMAAQKRASAAGHAQSRNHLLGDFHAVIAHLTGNAVLADIVEALVARTSLITLFYQNTRAAAASLDEHVTLMAAIEKRDVRLAVKLMHQHLTDVEEGLVLKNDSAPASTDLRAALGATGDPA